MKERLSRLLFRISTISIRNKILALTAVVIVVSLTVFAYFATRISSDAIIAKATHNAARELALIDRSLSTLAASAEDSIRMLSTNDRLQAALGSHRKSGDDAIASLDTISTLSSVISSMVTPNTHYAAASILTADQELFEIGYADNRWVRKILDAERLEAIRQKKTPSWTGLHDMNFRSGYKAPVFTIAKPIIELDTGRTLGTAALYLEESVVAAVYLENQLNQNDRFLVLDADMNVLSSANKQDLFQPLSAVQPLPDKTLARLAREGSVIRRIDGQQVLLTLHVFHKLDWRILSMIPLKEITTETRGITRLIVILGLGCLLFAVAASYLLAHTITRPILSLARLMKEMNRGNLDVRTHFTAHDEIGQLGDGFNRLMDMVGRLLEQVRQEQRLQHETEFRLLQSQIKPHFLYNTMETIISFIKLDMKDHAMRTAHSLAAFYRGSLSHGHDIISIREETALITSYLTIQQLRYVGMETDIAMQPDILDCRIPKLTLQPLVENAIYHGLKPKREAGRLTIKGWLDGDRVRLEVTDDGVGMTPETIRRVMGHVDPAYAGHGGQAADPPNGSRHGTQSSDPPKGSAHAGLVPHDGSAHGAPRDDGTDASAPPSADPGGAPPSTGSRFGLGSVLTRLRLTFGETADLWIESEPNNGTRVVVLLPAATSDPLAPAIGEEST